MNTASMNITTHRSPTANAAPRFWSCIAASRARRPGRPREFRVAYQGIYRVDSDELTQMEALILWQHPQYGMLLPGAFCEAFSDAEVILGVTWFVMDTVARETLPRGRRKVARIIAWP